MVVIETPVDGATFDEGLPIALQARVTDEAYADQLDTVNVTWSVGGARICDGAVFDPSGISTCDHVFTQGPATIAVQATDPSGQSATDSVEVTVNPNGAPTAEITDPTETGSYYSDTPIVFAGLVADNEDASDTLTVVFSSDVDGDLGIEGAPTSGGDVSGTAYLTQGNHFVTMTVTDTTGRTGQDTVSIRVKGANTLPACEILAPENNATASAGESVLFEATATDADIPANTLSVQWVSDKDGVIGTSTPSSAGDVYFGYDGLSLDTHTITLEVRDEVGALCTDAILVHVGNAPDVTLDLPTTGDVVNLGEPVAFQATMSDAEDRATDLSVEWSSDLDGVFSTQGANAAGISAFTYDDLSAGTHTVTVTVTDSDGIPTVDRATLYVNGLPSAPTVEITPDPATSGDILVANVTAPSVDPEGDAVTYTYEWFQNGVLTAYTTSTISPAVHARGEIWEVRVYGSDGYGSSPAGSDTVTIGNGAPSATTVTITPSSAYTDTTLTASVSGWSDPDGDAEAYRYQWYVDGAAAGSNEPTLGGAAFVRGQSVYVDVTPFDGAAYGTTLTSAVRTILNSAPTTPTVGILPVRPEDDDTLTCSVSTAATDADGDAVSYAYAWTRNGAATGIVSSTVDPSYTAEGDIWSCTVTPSDGTDTGPTASASVTVDDYTAPSAPVLSTISPYRNEDSVTIYSSSEASVTITLYITNSRGTTTQSTTASSGGSATFALSGLTRGDTYTFYAVATDGSGNVSGASNTIGTEACDPVDDYEDSTTYGDVCADPVVDWATLDDSGSSTISIVGNILDSSDEDWYLVETSDLLSAGINYYRFRVRLIDGTSAYKFVVYEGGCSSSYLDCSTGGYTEYEYFAQDTNDSGHGTPADTRYCNYGSYPYYNDCDDLSSDYYIKVIRTSSSYDCTPYELEISNGIW